MPYKDKQKQVEHNKKRNERVRRYVNTLKESKPCFDCGLFYPHYMMEFDHTRGVKIKNISEFANVSINSKYLQDELSKCDIVCANCHRTRTWKRNQCNRVHGGQDI